MRLYEIIMGVNQIEGMLKLSMVRYHPEVATAALHCEQVSDMLVRDLNLSQVQVDKLWTFAKKNTKIQLDRSSPKPSYR
jgi:hypothetical protein